MKNGTLVKTSLLLTFILIPFITLQAHNAVKVIQEGEEDVIFLLCDHPKVYFSDSTFIIETELDKVEYEGDKGTRFEFLDYDLNSVGETWLATPIFFFGEDILEGRNMTPNSRCAITSLSGGVLKTSWTDNSGTFLINISDLNSGVYIFSSKDKNFKFYKK